MPFKSEKQRRFLWAAHPDIAKRWAHEYPTKKKLPVYANQAKTDEKKETTNKQSAVNPVAPDIYNKLSKESDVKEVYIEQPASDKPTVAGENPPKVTKTKSERCNSETKPNYGKNPLMVKLSVVLSQRIMQALENERAEIEARQAALMPANAGIKRYAMPAMGTPLPMGMQPQAPQDQAQAPAGQPQNMGTPSESGRLPPVGGGSSPNANPINSYGAISSSGDINGNASFGTANSMGGEKLAAGFLGALGRVAGKAVSGIAKKAPTAATTAFKMPAKPTTQDLLAYGKQIGIGDKMPRYTHQEFANYQLMKQRINTQPAAARPAAPAPAAPRPAPAPKPAAPAARPAAMAPPQQRVAPPVPAYAPPPAPARPAPAPQRPAPVMDDLSLDDDIINSMAAFGKSSGSSPAWQRSAGKNPEGGLNEKGRKSYERETGGNLKAPVTESNPKGERAKRQNSFCSRMCGMKHVNTGSKTKSDPDSRINKSLRKWNCKCSSAYEFGQQMGANFSEKQAAPLGGFMSKIRGMFSRGAMRTAAKPVAAALPTPPKLPTHQKSYAELKHLWDASAPGAHVPVDPAKLTTHRLGGDELKRLWDASAPGAQIPVDRSKLTTHRLGFDELQRLWNASGS
jgi:hypothetical protein